MKIIIRNPVRYELELVGTHKVRDILKEIDLNPESHIVIRESELLTGDELVGEEDEIEILSAISGG